MAPFFIVCAPRSGSTLLRMVLDAHPRISVVLESIWFNYHALKLQRFQSKAPNCRDEAIRIYFGEIPDTAPIKILLKHEPAIRQAIKDSQGDLGRIYERLCSHWAHRLSGPDCIWGEKSVAYSLHIDNIRSAFPEAKFIHLIRDPRGTIYSMSKRSFPHQSDNVFINIHFWKRYTDSAMHSLTAVPDSNKLTVYYEDFVRSPEKETRRICQFLHVDFAPVMMKHHRFKKEIPAYKGSKEANQPISTVFMEEWKSGLTSLQIACIEEFGFETGLFHHYQRLNPPVSAVAKMTAMTYLHVLHLSLCAFESVVSRIRKRPFVWSRMDNMVRNVLYGPPQ